MIMEKFILCSLCFKNTGLRREAVKFGLDTNDACPNCGKRSGTKLNRVAVTELFSVFYCNGSRAAAYLPPVFIKGFSEYEDIRFEQSAREDYELLKRISGLALRRNSPKTHIHLGFTDTRSQIEMILFEDPATESEEVVERLREKFHKLIEAGSEYELRDSETVYRARISPEHPLEVSEYDSPPIEKVVPNRITYAGHRVFCGAFNIEPCLFEIRPQIDDLIRYKIFVASFKPRIPLRLIDFTMRKDKSKMPAVTPLSDLDITLQAFFQADDQSYHLTQLLSAFVWKQGYDGIVYPSAMECISGYEEIWKNIALFGSPVSDKKLLIESINRVLLNNVMYNFDLGPAWDDNEGDGVLAPFRKGWINRANR
jgi:hypothetical protein